MIRTFIGLMLLVNFLGFSQEVSLKPLVDKTVEYLNKSEDFSDQCNRVLKKCVSTKDKVIAKKYAEEALGYILQAKAQSDLAEKQADELEVESKRIKCLNAASEADDAEDYCRQLGYHTFEISIYAKKAMNETELTLIQEYIFKAQSYADMAYQAIKNARIELEDTVKDLEECN